MVEFWRSGGPGSLTPAIAARDTEKEGWDGQMFMDSQSLGGDPYVFMGHWAATTTRLKLSTGVTNPLTRHPAVTANAAATLQAISGGRYVLGIGRGDSALAYLGHAPSPLETFEHAVEDIQALLSGRPAAFGRHRLAEQTGSAAALSMGDRPLTARLGWLPSDLPKVPLDIAATGPKVIALAARLAERITFSVGAMPDRLRWAISEAETARGPHGTGPRPSYGAQIVIACHKDGWEDEALAAATRMILPLARFQVIQGKTAGPTQPGDEASYAAIRRSYAMSKHSDFEGEKLGGETIAPGFVRRFGIVGNPDHCIERLIALARLGLERFVIFGPGFHDDGGGENGSLFAREVMPAVRAALA